MLFRLYRSFFASLSLMSVAIIFSIVIFSILGVIQSSITKEIDKEYRPIFGSEVQFDIPYGSS